MNLRCDHDLTLPLWGPYSKEYFGVSHIADQQLGMRFDLSFVPGRFRGEFFTAQAIRPSGWLPWSANEGLRNYSYRQQIVWKDQVYAQISFAPGADGAQMKVELVNQTRHTECLSLHLCARLSTPVSSQTGKAISYVQAVLPSNCEWVDGLAYHDLVLKSPTVYSGLNYDAVLSGETQVNNSTNGFALSFGGNRSDRVSYVIPEHAQECLIRCRGAGNQPCEIIITVGQCSTRRSLPVGAFTLLSLAIPSGATYITFRSTNHQPLEIDGLAFEQSNFSHEVSFEALHPQTHPRLVKSKQGLTLHYQEQSYVLSWSDSGAWIREVLCDDLEDGVLRTLHEHTQDVVDAGGDGHMTDIFFGPINVAPQSSRMLSFDVAQLDKVTDVPAVKDLSPSKTYIDFNDCPKEIRFGQERLQAVVMTNIVFPIRNQGRWIRHLTPGRWWDSLYTWDSGCIGLGIATIDRQRAVDCLLAYLTEAGDKQAAFVHHGSMVPTQFFLALELWNKTQDRTFLEVVWPRLLQYYEYFIGLSPGSTMSPFTSGLLRPWDYFYNSGGWDDYPPQKMLAEFTKRRNRVAPCITTAMAIRCAKIMAMFAEILNLDTTPFLQNSSRLTDALQAYAWDETSAFFGYVEHDDQGQVLNILRTESGENFNRGMDGLSPLLADAVTPEQADRLWRTLLDANRFMNPLGLSAVDRQASYYRQDGYWNGSVWMPYQWFFWKALLDYGMLDQAQQLATRVLKMYGLETKERYACWEHFMVESERGAGWHHFGGLSAPLLNLFEAHYKPGTVTGGHNCCLLEQDWSPDFKVGSLRLSYHGAIEQERALLIVVPQNFKYQVSIDGQPHGYNQILSGCLAITRQWHQSVTQIKLRVD
ncbi:MGH1-like glycoside hydrolase domain-containing protein [Cerasicoccus maritimus]|uniref:MGH1-like glycoside hydrolase domain-containing protein n=1 Tax=Cerasicoccus maritimus TaxID=490089 RepID=UPI0028528DBC|nr:trehalase family glycosidase [Cerasicoccus maritimus]